MHTQPRYQQPLRPEAPPQEQPDSPERLAMVAAHERRVAAAHSPWAERHGWHHRRMCLAAWKRRKGN